VPHGTTLELRERMVERRFGPYELVRQIAVGGMAEIYLARTTGMGGFEKYVALKLIQPSLVRDAQFTHRLIDEAKIAVQLNHSNIVQTFDLGRVGDTFYITMEYVDGSDLFEVLRKCSELDVALPFGLCAFVAKEIAQALDHAHRKVARDGQPLGIVHRDVSPQNVLISRAGEVKLGDFGIAKAATKIWKTAAGAIQGKYHYMSPEQSRGLALDARSDVFSAGIVLYELITGQMMYREADLHRLLERTRRAQIVPPSRLRADMPPELERIAMRALARQPGDRYQTAADLVADLEGFLRACSPVLYAPKLAGLVAHVLGDVPRVALSIATDSRELRDENSVLAQLGGATWPFSGAATEPDSGDTTLEISMVTDVDHVMEIDTVIEPLPFASEDERSTTQHTRDGVMAMLGRTVVDAVPAMLASLPQPVLPMGIASIALDASTPIGQPVGLVPGVPAHLAPYATAARHTRLPPPMPSHFVPPFALFNGGLRALSARFVVPSQGVSWRKLALAALIALVLAYACARWASY
jgi:serine/threonine protein kinase